MNSKLTKYQFLSGHKSGIQLSFPVVDKIAGEYFSGFLPEKPYTVGEITIDEKSYILSQFKDGAPGLAEYGFIQFALSYYMDRYIVNIKTGVVYCCESSVLAHGLYEWTKSGRSRDLESILKESSEKIYSNINAVFKYFEKQNK